MSTNNPQNLQAVPAFYARHHTWLVTHLSHRLHNKADAEDICQQVFLRLCEQPDQLETIRNPSAWLATIASRLCIDHWRKEEGARRAFDAIAHQPQAETPSLEQEVANRQTLDTVVDQLEALPEKVTSIFIDTRVHALTGKQVAQRHNVSLRTVRNHLSLASQLLAARYQASELPIAAGF